MKACLMRVNYDPKYLHPSNSNGNSVHPRSTAMAPTTAPPPKSLESLQTRLKVTRNIYISPERKVHDNLQQRGREQLRLTVDELKKGSPNTLESNGTTLASQQKADEGRSASSQNASGVAGSPAAESTVETTEVVDLLTGSKVQLKPSEAPSKENRAATKPKPSGELPSFTQSTAEPARLVLAQRSVNTFGSRTAVKNDGKIPASKPVAEGTNLVRIHRSKTSDVNVMVKSQFISDVERQARHDAEKAIRDKKIFTVMGPYPTLRASLRRRGWVEKMNSSSAPSEGTRRISGDDLHGGAGRSLDDSNVVTMMSHFVRNSTPTLLFAVKATDVGSKVTKSTQLVNHFGKASTFTTKAGLCQNLRSVPWFLDVDPNSFYPRCYNLGDNDEKEAFFDDYRLSACVGFIKYFVSKYGGDDPRTTGIARKTSLSGTSPDQGDAPKKTESRDLIAMTMSRMSTTSAIAAAAGVSGSDDSVPGSPVLPRPVSPGPKLADSSNDGDAPSDGAAAELDGLDDLATTSPRVDDSTGDAAKHPMPKGRRLSVKCLQLSMTRCEKYLTSNEHGDLDLPVQPEMLTDVQWDQYLIAYHQFINNQIEMDKKALPLLSNCRQLLDRLRQVWLQFDLDGHQDVWILKPGAKSRGRGIQCTNRLSEIVESISSSDCALVAQKYIERPLLIYKTKFDIRQWFLVTDWNPLTLWFYNSCYLRFCSQEYTLNSFHVSIHLSNNSVQKYFASDPRRSSNLPADNMWSSDEFNDFLRSHGHGEIWSEKIVPGMKQAIVSVLLCTQDQVEHRKSAFELYGADFMITEDMQPWLIEINSSPSMARTTKATADLVDRVLEDTVKVVLDRKLDKNCDTGLFELIYKQQLISEPPQLEMSLSVEGKRIKRVVNRVP